MSPKSEHAPYAEKIGKRAGFFIALIIFASIMYYVASKFGIIQLVPYAYFVSAIIAIHIGYSVLKELLRK